MPAHLSIQQSTKGWWPVGENIQKIKTKAKILQKASKIKPDMTIGRPHHAGQMKNGSQRSVGTSYMHLVAGCKWTDCLAN